MSAISDGLSVLTIVTDGDKAVLAETVRMAADSPGEWELEIRRPKQKRSRDANAYAWVLIDKLAHKLNMSKTEVYQNVIRDIGGVSDIVCVQEKAVKTFRRIWEAQGIGYQTIEMPSKLAGCVNVIVYYGSSAYDTEQMARLIDELVRECKDQGIETMTPDELSRLEGYRDKAE